jgi:hypothetical protein
MNDNKVLEYIDGSRDNVLVLFDYWKWRHPYCNILIKVVNDMASEEPKHPMHTTLSDLEVATLIKLMKNASTI